MAKKEKGDKKKKKKGGTMSTIFLIVISLAMIVVFHTGFIFFMIGLMPSIVAFYLDRTRSRTTFHTVLACNLSGVIPFMAQMLKEGPTGGYTTELMSDGGNWLIIGASAGFGWVLVYAAPLFAQFIITMFHQGQIMRFETLQNRIVEDWGTEVAHFFPTEKPDDF